MLEVYSGLTWFDVVAISVDTAKHGIQNGALCPAFHPGVTGSDASPL